jgi:hypothetical protein
MATEKIEFGVAQTECACSACVVNCHFAPGSLIPADIRRIAEYLNESDLTRFAFDNLLASPGAIIYSVTRRDGRNCAPSYAYRLADEAPASLADRLSRRLSSHLVTKLHHAVLVGFDLRQMEGDVFVEFLEELDPITNQDRQDRITNFVG